MTQNEKTELRCRWIYAKGTLRRMEQKLAKARGAERVELESEVAFWKKHVAACEARVIKAGAYF